MQIDKLELYKNGIAYLCTEGQFSLGDNVIVESNRGQELATITKLNVKYDTNCEMLSLVRKAEEEDVRTAYKLFLEARSLEPVVRKTIKENNIDLKLTMVNYNFDKSKLIIYYTAEGRVDFRNLVKELANIFHIRIEMHQIGNREEVQMLGSMGCCGRECCCKLFLKDFDKVGMKMPKNQGLALNPAKINGMCGKLMCCLKYEDDNYREVLSKMPKVGAYVKTANGSGKVQFVDVLREEITVLFVCGDESERKTLKLGEFSFEAGNGYYD